MYMYICIYIYRERDIDICTRIYERVRSPQVLERLRGQTLHEFIYTMWPSRIPLVILIHSNDIDINVTCIG